MMIEDSPVLVLIKKNIIVMNFITHAFCMIVYFIFSSWRYFHGKKLNNLKSLLS